jgi:hypothetical protein
MLVQAVGTVFSAPRPFPPQPGPSFLVIIARDASLAELSALTPTLPIALSAPSPFRRRRDPALIAP